MSEEVPNKKLKTEDTDVDTKEVLEEVVTNTTAEEESNTPAASTSVSNTPATTTTLSSAATPARPKITFKNPKFSYIEPGGKKFVWKSLKQIVTQEKSLPWQEEVVLCKFKRIYTRKYKCLTYFSYPSR